MFKYKWSLFAIILSLCFMGNLFAQDDFQKWLKKDQEEFQSFLSEEDKAFSKFLKQAWEPFDSKKGQKADKAPKPVEIPVLKEKDKPKVEPKVPPKKIKKVLVQSRKPVFKPKPAPKMEVKKDLLKYKFLGVPLEMEYKKSFTLDVSGGISNQMIGQAWETMSKSNFKPMLEQLSQIHSAMALNDWGYIQLIQKFAKTVIPDSENKQILFMWFILNKNGYDTRLAYSSNMIYLLFPSSDLIFSNDFIQIAGKKYYFLTTVNKTFKLDKKVYSYKKTYSDDSKVYSMRINQIPNLNNEILVRDLKFEYNGNEISIPVKYEKDIVTYFKKYPQTQLEVYFDAPMSGEANYSLLNALRPHVEDLSELEAVNFLLRFVQSSFQYQTDDQQFGHEKYLMPEETLFYPSSDCEDRSILFAYLVQNLLGMRVVGLDYPGHIATGVLFNTPLPGKQVEYKNMSFLVCDPTFVNADAGMCMPQYNDVKPKVISLF